jgi:predicted transcriptional regulator
LDASIKSGLEDEKAGRTYDLDEVFDELRREMVEPRPEPARWAKIAR